MSNGNRRPNRVGENMERLITGRQIPVCSDASRRLDKIRDEIRDITQFLRDRGLHDEANRLDQIRKSAALESGRLEQLARNAYCVARRGQNLPS